MINLSEEQIFAGYTTNVYGRRAFSCYSCTNNIDTAHSRSKYQSATPDCGFSDSFNPSNSLVQRVPCYTYCMVCHESAKVSHINKLIYIFLFLEKRNRNCRLQNRC